ncbi:hypothetical protein CSC04_2932 [Enterobacter roggenkampii]|nr:hypothetical protein CSC04_2932 [Enterobacter roggenkampii]
MTRKLAEGARKIPFQLGSGIIQKAGITTSNSLLYIFTMLQEILENPSG